MKKFILLLLVVLAGNCVFALEFSTYKLDNGQTVIIKEVKNNPIVTIDTWIRTGSINENDKNNGVSHFLEHLFFKGTQKHPAGDFDKILESKGAITNAATSKDFTHYYITIPSNYFDLALEMHADMLLHPQIPRKELEKERKVVLEEIAKDQNSPSNLVYNNLTPLLYSTHPYKRRVIGTSKIIETITREEILEYYNTYYTPSNMITVIIGDVDTQKALEQVKVAFQSDYKKAPKNVYKTEKPLSTKAEKVDYTETQSGYMIMGFRGANAINPDTYPLDVLATILGEGRSSKLYQFVKEQKQLAYSISSSNASYKDDGMFAISANFVPDNRAKVENAIFAEIDKIQKQGVSENDLKIAKGIIERDTYYSRESISNIASEIGYTMVLTNNPLYDAEYLSNIQKVTASEVKHVAEKYLGRNKSATSIVLPISKKDQTVVEKPAVKYEAKLVGEIPTTQKYLLSNGSTMLISPNSLNDIIAISINAKGGQFIEKIPGTAFLAGTVMLKGTEKYSSIELGEIIEENGIKIEPGVTPDSFVLNVLTTKPQLEKTLEILDQIVNHATFDDYEIEKSRTAKLNLIKKSRDIPSSLALDGYKSLIFENSPYSVSAKILEKTLPQVQKENILDYYNKIFYPQNIVISVNGNVDTQMLTDKLCGIFASNSGSKFEYSKYAGQIPSLSEPKTSIQKVKDLKTAWIVIGWQAPSALSEKEYATFQVIDTILGSGMSSRLFKNLRDQEGLAYQLGSSYSPNVLKGAFIVYIGTNPKTLAISKQKLLEEVNALKTEFVSNKELQEAKDKILGNYVISLETNLDKASTVGWFEASGRGFAFKDKYSTLINSVTASDIIEVANKYFTGNYVTSIVNQ